MNARVAEQVDLENRLRKAVEQGELFLHYQPKFDLATGRIVGVEALMRWRAPDGGLVSPAQLRAGAGADRADPRGRPAGAGRGRRARISGWRRAGCNAPRIAVNVSALQLRRRSFVADVRAALGGVGADGGGSTSRSPRAC